MERKKYPYDAFGCQKIRVIDDTDCACEGDDAFAIAHLLLTSKLDVKAICAENYMHDPGSVERSFRAVEDLLDAMDLTGSVPVLRGSLPMTGEDTYETSEASDAIVAEAMKDDPAPLVVVCQGALTNVAVALKTEPAIAKRMHCIWIGGQPYPKGGWEFNLSNDVIAARTVMDSELSLWQVPADVYSMMRVSFAVLAENLLPCGKAGKYLLNQLWAFNRRMCQFRLGGENPFMPGQATGVPQTDLTLEDCTTFGCGEAWQLGDSPVVGLLLNCQPYDREFIGKPYINDDSTYTLRPENPNKAAVYHSIDSAFILQDLFAKMRFQYGTGSDAPEQRS